MGPSLLAAPLCLKEGRLNIMGNVQMEADQIRFKNESYGNVQDGLTAALSGGSGSSTLAELTDTDISTPTNGQVLTYDSTAEKWENANPATPATPALADLTDTAITSPTNGQVLTYDSSEEKWVNANAGGGGSDYTVGSEEFTSAASATSYADAKVLNFTGGGIYHIIASATGDGSSTLVASVKLVDASGNLIAPASDVSNNNSANPTVNALVNFGSADGSVKIQVKGTVNSPLKVSYMYKKVADAPAADNNSR